MVRSKFFSYFAVICFGFAGAQAPARAACSLVSTTLTCTGGSGATVTVGGAGGNTKAATYPASLVVSGAPGGASVTSVQVVFHGFSGLGTGNSKTIADNGILLDSPAHRTLEILHAAGDPNATDTFSNVTVSIADSNSVLAPNQTTAINQTGGTLNWKPSSYPDNVSAGHGTATYPSPAPPNGLAPKKAAPLGSDTLASVFTGDAPNGTWNIYMVDAGNDDQVSFTSFDLVITFSATAVSTSTSLTSSVNPSFTANPNGASLYTATVSSGSGTPTGSVTFTEGANTLCSSVGLNGSGIATCSATIGAEGIHTVIATYNPTGSFLGSNASVSQTVRAHSQVVGGQYCNVSAISVPGASNTSPYPSFINVGTDTPDITNSLATLTLTLKGISSSAIGGLSGAHMLLVAPGGRSLDFLSFAGGGTTLPSSNITFDDAAPGHVPANFSSTPAGGNLSFQTTSYNTSDTFPAPAPVSFPIAAPGGGAGAKTFTSEFNGASAHGDWTLFIADSSNQPLPISGGWCLNFTQATGVPTTTTLSGSPNRANTGAAVTVTATVRNSNTSALITQGNVTFTENGVQVAGGPASAVAVGTSGPGAGQASFITSSLGEGDHTITATYNDPSSVNSLSFTSFVERVDNATGAPAVNGSTFTFCNPGAVVLPGPNNASDIGPANPNPSNIFVTNLAGVTSTAGVDFKTGHFARTDFTSSLLVGPAQSAADSLDFFSQTGNGTSTVSGNFSFADAFATLVPTGAFAAGNFKPTSYGPATVFTPSASTFFTLPSGPYPRAATAGSATFTSVFGSSNPNGTWSLYLNQSLHNPGSGMDNGWCVDLTQTLPDIQLTGTNGAQMTDSGNFKQNGTGTYAITVHNNGPGATGNSPSNAAPTVTVSLDPGLSYAAGSGGTNWTCGAPSGQTLSCTFGSTVASGADFPVLTINANVGLNAPASVTSTATFSGGGDGTGSNNTATRSSTVIQIPKLTISKVHNGAAFTVNQNGSYAITVHNAGAGPTTTTVTAEDILPAGLTFVSAVGTGWSCTNSAGDVVCTNTAPIAATSDAVITLTAAVSGTATSIQNTATLSGGGGIITTNQSTDTVTVLQPAAVTNVTSTVADGTYTTAAVIPIVVTFSNPVTVTGTPMLALNSGGSAAYTSGSGTNSLTFTYTVAAGQSSAHLDYTSTGALTANGGTLKDPNNNAAVLTLPAPGAAGSLGANKSIVIDTSAPAVVSYNVLFGSQSFNVIGSPRNRLPWQITGIQVVFSKPITVGNINSLSGVTATGFSGLGTTTLTWTVSPISLASLTTTLAGTGANALKAANGLAIGGGVDFSQALKVLWADVNDDGVVNASDLVLVNNARAAAYNVIDDLNGDGVVNVADVQIVRSRNGTTLP